MRLVIENGLLIDGTGADPVPGARIVVDDGKVVAVGNQKPPDLTDGAKTRTIDASGKTVLPGLFDMHVHSTFRVQRDVPNQVREVKNDPDHVILQRAIRNVQDALRSGVTSLRDCGGKGHITIWLKNLINEGHVTGPRMFVSGMPITTTAGHLNWLGQTADSIPEIRTAVRRMVSAGADVIKVCATGGAMTPGSNRTRAQYSIEELTALVEDAHRLNRTVSSHSLCTEGMVHSVAAGCDTIEHCYWYGPPESEQPLHEETAHEFARKGLFCSPVIGAGDQAGYLGAQCPVPLRERWHDDRPGEDHYDLMRTAYGSFIHHPESKKHFDNLIILKELGIPFVCGTDAGAGITRFQDTWMCLGVFVHSLGFSVVEAVRTATQLSARALKIDDRLGTIEPGKLADIILVEGNLVDDGIHQLQCIGTVIKEGRVVADQGQLVDQYGIY